MKTLLAAACFLLFSSLAAAAELSGVFVDDEITTDDGQRLALNGIGLREKFWIDVYVGSLYLPAKSDDVAEILSKPGPWRIQLDFIYKEVSPQQLVDTWREGFEKNQSADNLKQLQSRIDQFYAYFEASAVAKDRYTLDYSPASGTRISKNQQVLGIIAGEDFRNAVLEIWLGNHPADKNLKKGMLGL
jgi:hypothetical protein